jgi:hypothetical protein
MIITSSKVITFSPPKAAPMSKFDDKGVKYVIRGRLLEGLPSMGALPPLWKIPFLAKETRRNGKRRQK